jgi:putative tricarboxylic transport membrane protein
VVAIDALFLGFQHLFQSPFTIFLLVGGTLMGMIFGAIPGLTGTLAITLLLPFTFVMSPSEGLTLLVALYVGGISGGLIAAILLNIPGAPASLVTCFDGYPMAKKGKPVDALLLGAFSSLVGGLLSAIPLIIISPLLAKVALAFGPAQYFALGLMGLSVVVSLTSRDQIKGLISAIVGVTLAMVGADSVLGVPRFTFGIWSLNAGLDVLATLMGLFALAEILTQLRSLGAEHEIIKVNEKIPFFPAAQVIKRNIKGFVWGTMIGTWIGILPGVGQSTGSLMAYNQARETSKYPEKFGTGVEEGIIASETANNAVCGGALIPMMTLGIPGDLVTSILMGGLIMHGLQPGPLLFTMNKNVVGAIFVAYIVALVVMYIMQIGLMRFFIRLLTVPKHILFPVILVMCVIGSYTVNNRMLDPWVLLIMGIIGYLLTQSGFSLPPIVLGYILGPIIESNFRIAAIAAQNNVFVMVSSPITIVLLLVSLMMLVWPIIKKKRSASAAS